MTSEILNHVVIILVIDICHDYFDKVGAIGSLRCPNLVNQNIQVKSCHLSKAKGSNRTNLRKWPNTLKQFVGNLPTNCLSVFGHFMGLALKGLKVKLS